MNITGILMATLVVGAVGLFVGLFLGIAGIKFKVEVDEKEEAVLAALFCRVITAADAVMQAVPVWRRQSLKERRR